MLFAVNGSAESGVITCPTPGCNAKHFAWYRRCVRCELRPAEPTTGRAA